MQRGLLQAARQPARKSGSAGGACTSAAACTAAPPSPRNVHNNIFSSLLHSIPTFRMVWRSSTSPLRVLTTSSAVTSGSGRESARGVKAGYSPSPCCCPAAPPDPVATGAGVPAGPGVAAGVGSCGSGPRSAAGGAPPLPPGVAPCRQEG